MIKIQVSVTLRRINNYKSWFTLATLKDEEEISGFSSVSFVY